MYGILRRMANDWGYTVEPEKPAAFGERFDMQWASQSDDEVIFVEHENNPRNVLKSEIPKLLRIGAALTVLITYLPANWSRGILDIQVRFWPQKSLNFCERRGLIQGSSSLWYLAHTKCMTHQIGWAGHSFPHSPTSP